MGVDSSSLKSVKLELESKLILRIETCLRVFQIASSFSLPKDARVSSSASVTKIAR